MSEVQKVKEIVPYICKPRAPRETETCIGDRWMIKAKLSIDPVTGEKKAEPGEKIDHEAYIQASKASTDIAQIVARWEAGDESVINVNPYGFTGDVSLIPNSVNDVTKINQMTEKAAQSFDQLPDDLKARFGNSSAEFFNKVLDGSASEIIAAYKAAAADPKVEVTE